jgi:FtsP/CotA-like multicopper oxidase with cupredoxin domain
MVRLAAGCASALVLTLGCSPDTISVDVETTRPSPSVPGDAAAGGHSKESSAPDAGPVDSKAQPANWSVPIQGPLAEDESPEPDVFETHIEAYEADLEILPGKTTPVWTYNGNVSGPEIRVSRGDRVVVHFTNNLPEPTTIHWHGLRIPVEMDGVPGESQPEVKPGETFTYDFVVPDAGLFWYHPHVNSAAQAGFGLYGALLVSDPEEPADLGDELTLVLSDMSIEADGSLSPANVSGDLGTLFGREGNVLLVNGKVDPVYEARAGRRQRWRVVNASRSRYYQLALHGNTFTRIGGDGGMLEHPEATDTVVVSPGERADVILQFNAEPGTLLPVRWVAYDRGFGSTFARPDATVFRIQTTLDAPFEDAPLPTLSRTIEPIDIAGATVVPMELTQNDVDGKFALGINGVPSWDAPPLMVTIGDTHVWELKNTIEFAHPFHLHGFFFQVLEFNGVVPSVREWKDTVDVPVNGFVKIAVRFDERPGMWMFHCHILDHADAGMMGMVHLHDAH